MYRVLIVEDEPEEARRLTGLIERYGQASGDEFQVVWHASAVEMVSDKSRYDLMLLDIDLPGVNGMEAAHLVRVYDEVTPIIFVTNLAQYAVSGYEVGATGFIVKPATYGSLRMNLDRAMRKVRQGASQSVRVSTDEGVRVVPVSQIVWIEIKGHRVTFHLEDAEDLESYGSLSQVEKDLAGAPILRVSKSFVANMDKVRRVSGLRLLLTSGDEIPISRARRREIVDTLNDYLGGR